MMPTISEYSAGGVVYQHTTNRWLICQHAGYHKWILPKGIVEEGESPKDAAMREVKEEAGITAKIIRKIEPDERYFYRKGGMLVNKRVTFYLMEYIRGDIANHSFETEAVRWVSADEALKLLAFDAEKQIFSTAQNILTKERRELQAL